jgi:hypothetical protein
MRRPGGWPFASAANDLGVVALDNVSSVPHIEFLDRVKHCFADF